MTSQANIEILRWATHWFRPRAFVTKWVPSKKKFKKRFGSLEKAGYATATSSRTRTQTVIGLSMMGIGYYLRHSSGKTVLYRYTAKPGESVRIKVIQGTRTLADATVET